MPRRLFTILSALFTVLSALSLLLCVATAVMWVRSYWAVDAWTYVAYDRSGSRQTLASARVHRGGVMRLAYQRTAGMSAAEAAAEAAAWPPGLSYARYPSEALDYDAPNALNRLGFGHVRWNGPAPGALPSTAVMTIDDLSAPWWSVGAAAAVLPAARAASVWRGRRRRTRARAGLCPSCGYDLRATPDRCPECGAAR